MGTILMGNKCEQCVHFNSEFTEEHGNQQICRAHPMQCFLLMEMNRVGPPTPRVIQMFPRVPADGLGCGEFDPGDDIFIDEEKDHDL